jgi:transposase-like protein
MATIEDKLTAEVVPLKPFTYDQAKAALPRQKNISALARQWGVPRSTARRWVARFKAETRAARKAANSVASSAATGAQTGQQNGAAAPHEVPQSVPRDTRSHEDAWMCPPAPIQRKHQATPDGYGFRVLTLTAAVALAAVAAYFSITGMTILFPGAAAAVIAMAAAMEAGKLVGAAWLGRHWCTTGVLLRATLTVLIVTLAVINAVGVYGRLTAAHLTVHAAAMAAAEQQASTVGARIEAQAHVVGDLDRRIAQIDTAIEEAAKRGRGRAAMVLAEDQRRNRDTLVAQRQREAAALVSLKANQAQVQAEARRVEADIGPLRYAAMLLGIDSEQALRLLILLMVLCCDPMAIVLVIAASARRQAAGVLFRA